MSELEQRLSRWRSTWTRRGGVRAWQLDELEDHLACAYAIALEAGEEEEQAWSSALEAVGPVDHVRPEYLKERIMTPTSKFVGLALTVSLIALVLHSGGGLQLFVSLPGLVLVSSITSGGLVASFGASHVLRALRACVGPSWPLSNTAATP